MRSRRWKEKKTNGRRQRLVKRLAVPVSPALHPTLETNLEAQERVLVLGRELRCASGRGHRKRKRERVFVYYFSQESPLELDLDQSGAVVLTCFVLEFFCPFERPLFFLKRLASRAPGLRVFHFRPLPLPLRRRAPRAPWLQTVSALIDEPLRPERERKHLSVENFFKADVFCFFEKSL